MVIQRQHVEKKIEDLIASIATKYTPACTATGWYNTVDFEVWCWGVKDMCRHQLVMN